MTEQLDREVKPSEILEALLAEYVDETGLYQLVDYDLSSGISADQRCIARVKVADNLVVIDGEGTGPIDAFINGMVETLNEPLNVCDYHENAMTSGKDAQAMCVVSIGDEREACIGIGLSRNTITASLKAIVSALNRRWLGR